MNCRNCKYWYNRQRELNYNQDNGFCEVNSQNKEVVLNRKARSGTMSTDRDAKTITELNFGCIHFEPNFS